MNFEKPNITRDDLRDLRKFLKKNCPGLKITTGRGGWWRMTYVYGGGEHSRFTEEEKQFLTQIGLYPAQDSFQLICTRRKKYYRR